MGDYGKTGQDYYEGGGHTGDPALDAEFERGQGGESFQYRDIPESVNNFVVSFAQAIKEKNVYEVQRFYEQVYPKLTEQYYKTVAWPGKSEVESLVPNFEHFHVLYSELYFRHVYARVQGGPTLEQRFDSYWNYCSLFNFILSAEVPEPLELPNQWLWEMVDEFLYQFSSFCQYRSKLQTKREDELNVLKDNPRTWNVHSVLNVLYSLVEKSNINEQLEVFTAGGNPDSVAGEFGRHTLYKMLGYFSLVGLLRLHSLLGDFYQAIKVLENIELTKKNLYSSVPACHISMHYYVGFAYMMMRRYVDAIRTFSDILLYIQRTKQHFQTRTYQNDQINKQTDQMYTLLAVCLVLHPQRIDESVTAVLRERAYADKQTKMQKGDLQEFETCFAYACPKFISPMPPATDAPLQNFHKEPLYQQMKVFMDEVKQQQNLPIIRSYLKLYTTMPLSKLAVFLEMSEDEFRQQLLCFKHKMKNMVLTKGATGLEGEFQSGSEVDFYIDKDMIHIADTKVARRYGDFFIRYIHKFEELNGSLKQITIK